MELCDWSGIGGIYEPLLTCRLTTTEVSKFIDNGIQVPMWPWHAQSIERCVKQAGCKHRRNEGAYQRSRSKSTVDVLESVKTRLD